MSISFSTLGVSEALSKALAQQSITVPTPIQAATLPDSLAGRDVLGRGRTGSGKTYAFLLPIISRLQNSNKRLRPYHPHAMILAPTRELVSQIEASLAPLEKTAGLTSCTIFGGVAQRPQVVALKRGVDIIVACPGRLEDLMNQNFCSLDDVEISVLDEADYMADLGFLPVVRRLLKATPSDGQRLLFSATLDGAVSNVVKEFLNRPVTHHADSAESPVSTMIHHALHVKRDNRIPVLIDLLGAPGQTIVFTRTKYGAKKLTKVLNSRGVPSVELHGNLSQGARERNLGAFQNQKATTLVATDIAARGIHVDGIALVIHADPPVEHKAYVHRSGRTARAGSVGTVVTMVLDEQKDDVQKLMKRAGITALVSPAIPGDDILQQIAPGARHYGKGFKPAEFTETVRHSTSHGQRPERSFRGQRGRKPRPRNNSNGDTPANPARGGRVRHNNSRHH